jgi:predicted histone-like DNA-binding protein
MGLQFRKAKVALNFREGKPQVYKLRQLTYPAVTTDQLVAECANSCGVNPSQTKAVIDALVNRLVHYMAIGHGVKMGEFGSFKPTFNSKTVKMLGELEGDAAMKTIKVKKIQFFPGKAFTQMLDALSISSAGEALDVKE